MVFGEDGPLFEDPSYWANRLEVGLSYIDRIADKEIDLE